MAIITIYTKSTCSYCHAAKALLARKGAAFEEIDVTHDPAGQRAMSVRAQGRSSVPQIFIDNAHIGGCDDLYDLDAKGGLDPLIGA